jgi:hypothetical protein
VVKQAVVCVVVQLGTPELPVPAHASVGAIGGGGTTIGLLHPANSISATRTILLGDRTEARRSIEDVLCDRRRCRC